MECSRREFFGQIGRSFVTDAANVVGAIQTSWVSSAQPMAEPQQRWLRPPGALPESQFLSTCTRCTACQEVCPYQSIRRLGPEFVGVEGTPAIIPNESPCYLCEDMPCITACEPRALLPIPRTDIRIGMAVIDESTCYVAQGQPCDYCVKRCPLRDDAIGWDVSGFPRVVEDGCTGCGVCAYLCPARAIDVVPS